MSAVPKETAFVLGPESAGIRLTPAEFDAITEYDDNYAYELVDGVLVVLPIPSEGEVGPNEVLGHWLYFFQTSHPEGAALNWTLPERYIRLPNSRRKADRVLWAGFARMPNLRRELPTVAIEFVSRGRRNWRRDYIEKRDEYREAGLGEYWVIDRFQRTMTVFRRVRKRIREIVITEDETYETPLLPGFELPLRKLLEVADLMEEATE